MVNAIDIANDKSIIASGGHDDDIFMYYLSKDPVETKKIECIPKDDDKSPIFTL